ncbi:MAG: flippase-like domain-containing protein [Ignavibacteriae bacterium]|nr:flippase-like domain-containing protein [Ignavibacteriota bacterium]
MRKKFKQRLLLSLAFGALVFFGFTVFADAEKLASAFGRFSLTVVPLLLLCTSANYTFRYLKWDYYTRLLGVRPALGENIIIFFAAFVMAVTPGKLGEVLKSYLLKEVNNTPIAISAPIILAERLTDFIGLMVIIIAGASVFGYARGVVAAFAVFFAGVTVLLSWRKGSLGIIAALERVKRLRTLTAHARTAYESMYALVRPRALVVAVLLSVVAWAFECFGYWLVLHEFQAPPTVLKAAFIYAFSTIVGAVTMLPGGLGTTEGSLTGLTMLAGASKDVAVASTFIIRVATLWFAVLIGIVVTFGFQHRLRVRITDLELDAVKER